MEWYRGIAVLGTSLTDVIDYFYANRKEKVTARHRDMYMVCKQSSRVPSACLMPEPNSNYVTGKHGKGRYC